MSGYVYIESEPNLFTVGFYKPDGQWEPDSDHATRSEAAVRVNYLNGGGGDESLPVTGTGREPVFGPGLAQQ